MLEFRKTSRKMNCPTSKYLATAGCLVADPGKVIEGAIQTHSEVKVFQNLYFFRHAQILDMFKKFKC